MAEVIIACRDPFAEVDGRGAAILRRAGVSVMDGVRRQAAEALNAGFFETVHHGRSLAVEDGRPGLVDAVFEIAPGETRAAALARAAAAGLTRVRLVEAGARQR